MEAARGEVADIVMHRINRLEIELEAEGEPLAREVSGLAARMLEGRLAPVIDRVCGELSGAEALDRLDRLEVDLGGVPAERFEEELPARLEQALRAALAEALRRQGPRADAPGRASLELLETFALTGSVPWWADAREEGVVARHFARAAAGAPEALVELVRRVSADTGAVERLARACGAEALLDLAGAPEEEREVPLERRRALLIELAGSEPASAGRGARARRERAGPSAAETTGVAGHEGLEGPEAEERAAAAGHIGRGARAAPVAAERGADAGAERDGVVGQGPAAKAARVAAADLEADTAVEAVDRGGVAGREAEAGARAEERAPERGEIAGPEVARRAGAPRPAEGAKRPPAAAPPPALAATIRAARRAVLSRLDEVYVDTAGLVILWPFLERFFERLGLLGEDRRFTSEPAALQGVALLEALATGEPDPLELRLALPKVLCGRDLESDFHLDHPLSPDQLTEAEALLTAAIDRAGVLGELSISGFRATFLQRRGALTTRDGAWLLQVERQAHDLLLDRFPWSWGWVKLPWMPHPMQVEW